MALRIRYNLLILQIVNHILFSVCLGVPLIKKKRPQKRTTVRNTIYFGHFYAPVAKCGCANIISKQASRICARSIKAKREKNYEIETFNHLSHKKEKIKC